MSYKNIKEDLEAVEKEVEQETEKEAEEVEEETSAKQDKLFFYAIGLIIILFAAFFAVRIFYNSTPEVPHYEYNHFDFYYEGGLWRTNWESQEKLLTIRLHYGPEDLEDVRIIGWLNDTRFNTRKMYITFDANASDQAYISLAAGELTINIVRVFGVKPESACYANNSWACEDQEIITCNHEGNGVIYLKYGSNTGIHLDDNCIILEGQREDLVKVVDRLLYMWYDIMPNDQATGNN